MRYLVLLAFPALLACEEDSMPAPPDAGGRTDAGTPGIDEEGCRILTLGRRELQFNLFNQLTGLSYEVTPNLEGDARDLLLIELYDSTTAENFPALMPGTFDLAANGDDDLATCQHCVWIKVDETPEGTVEEIYYQSKGTLTLERVSDPFEPIFSGRTSRVVLHRATVTPDGHSVFVPGGDCVSIAGVEFDTSPAPGRSCDSAEDCGNPLLEVCDPEDRSCGEPQCGEFLSCLGAEQVCVSQYRDLFFGACYESCDPGAAAGECGDRRRCVQFGVDPGFGLCKDLGEGGLGASCEPADNSTSCAGDALCSELSLTCTSSCRFFDAAAGCTSGQACSLFGVCEPASSGSPAVIGAACRPEDQLAAGCGADGQAFRGICFAFPPEPLICERACLGERGCGGGEFCALRFSSGLGICRPLPVCGDGERGEINEVCDDGNRTSGDGCSADCQVVEYEVICASLPPLSFLAEVSGDTTIDGFQSSCQLGVARAALYEVAPLGPGRLTLSLTSTTNQTLAIRGACADPGSELGCAERAPAGEPEELVVQLTSTSAAALTVVVSAFTVLEEGRFTLRAEFVAERCGDGVVAGNEVCDDGNTAGGDGCSADCREVEYDFYCAAAAELSTSAPNTGDTTGAPDLFLNRCSAEAGIDSGPDRLYRYTAPSDGLLHLVLESPDNLVIAVLDGCGSPDEVTELGCNTVFTLGTLDVPVSAGQELTVYVDGFLPDDFGTYSLQATFMPE